MNSAAAQIREEIGRNGPITFARFMELALYFPGKGYYERDRPIGRDGDFFTSVSVGPLFGELLAFQFAGWLRAILSSRGGHASGRLQLVETGAHDGRLAGDVLAALKRNEPDLFERIEYWIMDAAAVRRDWQAKMLSEFGAKVRWFDSWTAIPGPGVRGIIFSNEFLDALPVHRIGWSMARRQWFEWRVGSDGDRFRWAKDFEQAKFEFEPPTLPPDLLRVLPDEFTTEVSPLATQWWNEAALGLREGVLLTIDYGLEEDEFLLPHRQKGTLRAYLRHELREDLLSAPGEQDLTAHVNFSSLHRAGERAGLKMEVNASQSVFLTGIATQTWQHPGRFGDWNAQRKRQFQTLTHPEHLGRSFRVLAQSR